MILYTFQCFHMFRYTDEQEKRHLLRKQIMLTFFMNFTAFLNIYLITEDFEVILFYVEMTGLFAAVQILFRIFYKKASLLLINNMCMLLSIGFIMLCRLDMEKANKQLLIVSAACILSLIIPVMIRKMKFLKKLTWVYAGAGILLLTMVLVLAQTTYGAKLSIMGFQPTEVIKITFVFFMAALLWNDASFSQVVNATIIDGVDVLILVFCPDF